MATITISATVGPNTFTETKTLTDSDAGRLITWAKAQYGSDLTNAQAFTSLADGVLLGLRANVLNYEKANASQTAQAGVADVTIS